jgi:FKBP-type peptidyl-prolyl cis-trans isomerase
MSERGTGDVYIVLDFAHAPRTSLHILDLVKKGFYTGIKVHRIVSQADFAVVQWGNADSKKKNWDNFSESGSGVTVKQEKSGLKHLVGAVGLARGSVDVDSGDSQIYICLLAVPRLDDQYTVFGQVVAGLQIPLYAKQGNTAVVSAEVLQEGPDVGDARARAGDERSKRLDAMKRDAAMKFADPTAALKWSFTDDDLRLADVTVGAGVEIGNGKTAVVNYTGWLDTGTKFDSSKDRSTPIKFKVGGTTVIRGWEEGILGMKIGGVRKIIIPPQLAYGAEGRPPTIPANSTLVFEVELVGIEP